MGMTSIYRWLILLSILLFAGGAGFAQSSLQPLEDNELDEICATGLNIVIDLDLDLQTPEPNSLLIDPAQLDALRALADNSLQRTSLSGSSTGGVFSTAGIDLANFTGVINNSVTNNVNITDNALQNAQSLLNIVALGDVAVGLNLVVIVNPGDAPFSVTQTNINWSNLLSAINPVLPAQ